LYETENQSIKNHFLVNAGNHSRRGGTARELQPEGSREAKRFEGKDSLHLRDAPAGCPEQPGNCPICGMKLTPVRKQGGERASVERGERKIKHYQSTMNPGEVKPGPGKDSMDMDMVPVYEDGATAAESSAIAIDPVTTQNMGIRTATSRAARCGGPSAPSARLNITKRLWPT